jgi:hypothetical protein
MSVGSSGNARPARDGNLLAGAVEAPGLHDGDGRIA